MATMHATAVLVGERAVLIRGPSGAGKSRLALELIAALPKTCLIGDDRLLAVAWHQRLVVRPAPTLAGLMEVHGLGIRRMAYAPSGVVGWVVDLMAHDAARLPAADATSCIIDGVLLPRLPLPGGIAALPIVRAWLAGEQFAE